MDKESIKKELNRIRTNIIDIQDGRFDDQTLSDTRELVEGLLSLFNYSNSISERTDIKTIEKEFEEKFGGHFNDCVDDGMELLGKNVWNFFEPHLNSRNLLERFVKYLTKMHGIGFNYSIIDEFIESEKNE